MAVEYIELQETRAFSENGGRVTASRKFRIWDDASPITTPKVVRESFGDPLPEIGELFPDEKVIYCTGYNIRSVPDTLGVWEVDFTYENSEPGEKLPQEEGYVQITIDYAAEFRDQWRSAVTIPANGTPTGTDCGGNSIDKAGVPLSILVRMSDLTITETVAAATISARSLTIRAARGRRNSATFQGAPIGQVLYTGATMTRIGLEKYQITHKFRQDENYHMIQSARRNQLGQVDTVADTQGVYRAGNVDLVQPFPQLYDFNTLSENF